MELEDAVDGLGGMGQHPTPPRLERYGDGIPLTHPASGMGREWGRGGPAQTRPIANPTPIPPNHPSMVVGKA